jgi:hypothetical protein
MTATTGQSGETRPPKPNRIAFREIPAALEGITDDRWCVWRWIWRDNKWTKPPLQAGGSFGDTSDPATWCSLETAQAARTNGHNFDGIGLNLKDLVGYACIDLDDCRDLDTGRAEPWAKELILKAQTYAEATPSGTGYRIIGTVPLDFRPILGAQRKIGDGHVEIYVNMTNGRYITVTGVKLDKMPDELADISWLVDELTAKPKKDGKANGQAEPEPDLDAEAMDEAAAAAQLEHLDPDMAGIIRDGVDVGERSEKFFHACGYLKDKGFTRELGLALLKAFPKGIASKYVERGDLEKQVAKCFARAEDKAHEEPGTEADKDAADIVLAYLNERHFIVREGSKIIVYSPRYDPLLNRVTIDGMSRADFSAMYENRSLRIGKDVLAWSRFWLTHPQRRQYLAGVVCDPSGKVATEQHYNLWRSFSVEAKAGNWILMRRHIQDVICCCDEASFAYVMGWLAFLVQHPEIPPEVALVLCGGKGSGKGILGRALVRLFGQHAMHISNARHLVGNFNNHLRDCIFLFADEAFFAGDKQHESVLKALISEPYLAVEAKYRDAVQMPNLLHILMCSNEVWVAPASHDERRFAILKISDARRGDRAYFKGIIDQMEAGGHAAMLHDLLEYDLSDFQIRDVPETAALMDNKAESLTGAAAWLHDVLQRGYIDGEPVTTGTSGTQPHRIELRGDTPNIIDKADAFHDFTKNMKHYRTWAKPLAIFLRDLYAIENKQLVRSMRSSDSGVRMQNVVIPPLAEAREIFARFMEGAVVWYDE